MYNFSKLKISEPFIDSTTLNYTYGKMNGIIIADINNNSFIDFVTFPSTFDAAVPKAPVVWSNNGDMFSTRNEFLNANSLTVQYFRDSVKGDFNGDGYLDFIQIDQGWELNDRNPDYFFGHYPALLLGGPAGLTHIPVTDWLLDPQSKIFNHIGATADFDKDGDLDLIIAGFWDTRLYRNDGNGKFEWLKDALPKELTADPSRPSGFSNSASKPVSGATFLKLGDEYAIIVGHYRSFDRNDPSGTWGPQVLEQKDGKFIKTDELSRPQIGGREVNYGAGNMYNIDLNGNGREDLLIVWETEALGGVDDGKSTIIDGPYANATRRYADLSDSLVTVYLQTENGTLAVTPDVYSLAGQGGGLHLYFDDINGDGIIDFWNTSFGITLAELHKAVWLGDGRGGFYNPEPDFFKFSDSTDQSWTPFLIDANNNGALDLVGIRPVFSREDYFFRNIGEEVGLFLNEATASPHRKLNGELANYQVRLDDHGIVTIEGLGLDLRMAAVERLSFLDSSLAFDTDGIAGQAYRLYKAAFDRTPDLSGLGFWINALDAGADLTAVAGGFIGSAEFQSRYGAANDTDFIKLLYENVLDRQPEQEGFEYWTTKLSEGHNRETILLNFSESPENKSNVAGLIANGIEYTAFVG